ncbi:MAG: zf-HC2 domain-containing protein [Chloroflexi bacterium]|nr:zf-HC2 domain-containing protein [Chloroflexota bacterium]
MECQEVQRLLPVRQELSHEKNSALQAHLVTCATCTAEWNRIERTQRELLRLPYSNSQPPEKTISAVQARLAGRRFTFPKILNEAATGVFLVAVVGLLLLSLSSLRAPVNPAAPGAVVTPDAKPIMGVKGKVTSVSNGTIKVETGEGIKVVQTNDQTVFNWVGLPPPLGDGLKQNGQAAQVSDIVAGLSLGAVGTLTKDNVLVAQQVSIALEEIQGEATGTGANTITLKTPKGDQVIQVNAQTIYLQGKQQLQAVVIKPGDQIIATGKPATAGNFVAQVVILKQPGVEGVITAVNGNTITVQDQDRTVTVVVENSAQVKDFQVGRYLAAEGTVDGSGVLHATSLFVTSGEAAKSSDEADKAVIANEPKSKGRVVAISNGTITLDFGIGQRIIQINAQTEFRHMDGQPAQASDLVVGAIVGADGTPAGDGSLIAAHVYIADPASSPRSPDQAAPGNNKKQP